MLIVSSIGNRAVYITGPDAIGQRVKVGRKIVFFDFCRNSGPLLVDADGEPLEEQPISDDHPFWGPFEVWLDGYHQAQATKSVAAYLAKNTGTRRPLTTPNRSSKVRRALTEGE